MKPTLEKLIPPAGSSFRCFDRSELETEIKWHRHPELEINFVGQGSGTRMVGDHIGEYKDGDLVLLGSNLPHTWMSDKYIGKRFDRHPSIVIQFSLECFGAILDLPEMEAIRKLLARGDQGIWFQGSGAEHVGELMTRLVTTEGSSRLIGLFQCLEELSNIKEATPLATPTYSSSFDKNSDVRIQEVCQYINSRLTDPELDLGGIPKLVEMNPSAFSRFFKKTTGRTLTRYVNELRIGLACRRLADTKATVLDISFQVGFGNLSNFNRRFREIKGVTPRQFRKKATSAVGKS